MATAASPVKLLKRLIWLYLVLLLVEGALRKWAAGPSLSNVLLIIRDPVVILIYLVAMSSGRFVFNGYVAGCLMLAAGTFCASLLAPDSNLYVTLIGMRCYFLHLPLIFVMERTLKEEDIWKIGKFLLWFAIPETLLCVQQFLSPQTALVNLSVGGQLTQGMSGALDKFRPSGTFSFTTGVAALYPLVLAVLLGFLLTRKKIPTYLSIAAAVCVAVAIPVSISRTNALTCALVLLASGVAVFFLPSPPKAILRVVLFLGVVVLISSWLPHFDEGVAAFSARWSDSTGQDVQGFQTNIVQRFFGDLLPSPGLLFDAPVLGVGVGLGTPMAQAFLTGARQFALGEAEWQRVILEMGPIFGIAFILLRVSICIRLVRLSILSLRRENIWPTLFAVEGFFLVLNAQWGQATTLGFATFSAGLAFASVHMVLAPAKIKVRKKYRRPLQPGFDNYEPKPESGTSYTI